MTPSSPSPGSGALASIGEFGLIDRLSRLLRGETDGRILGIGDDAAVFPLGSRTLLATADALLEGTHFRRDWTGPVDLGWKALAVNLSDFAAMGGEPLFALISLGIPRDLDVGWIEEMYRGMDELSAEAGCPVLGGDTFVSPDRIVLSLAALGEAPGGRYSTRSGARPGDALLVTGSPGESLAGYYLLRDAGVRPAPEQGSGSGDRARFQGQDADEQACLRAHLRPQPRLAAGRAAVATGAVHAMMDVSDGLSGDVRHLARRSAVGIRIREADLPLSDPLKAVALRLGRDPAALALAGGEEYELLMAVPPDGVEKVLGAIGIGATIVGEATDRPDEIALIRQDGSEEPLPRLSWDHFRSESA